MAKREKTRKIKESGQEESDHECNHDFHLIRSFNNFMLETIIGVFMCSKCGLIKKVTGKEEF